MIPDENMFIMHTIVEGDNILKVPINVVWPYGEVVGHDIDLDLCLVNVHKLGEMKK